MSDDLARNEIKSAYEPVNYVDPVIGLISDQVKVPVINGGEQITPYKQMASSASQSGVSWNVVMPSLNTILHPVVYVRCKMTINFTSNKQADNPIFKLGDETWNEFPLSSGIFDVATVTVNNSSVTFECGQNIAFLKRLLSKNDRMQYSSICPTGADYLFFPDQIATGCIQNNFAPWGDSIPEFNRGGFYPTSLSFTSNPDGTGSATALAGTMVVEFYEPLLLPIFSLNASDSTGGLSGINNLRINVTFKGAQSMRPILTSALHSTGPNVPATFKITSLGLTQSETELQLFLITPPPSKVLPRTSVHPYTNIVRSVTSWSAGADTPEGTIVSQVAMNNINLGVLPETILIGVRVPVSSDSWGANLPEYWCPITGLNLTLNNRSGLLSNATPYQLYNMSKEAGLQEMPWSVFSNNVQANNGAVGSFCAFSVAKHLPVDPMYAPNSVGQFNFYGNVTFVPPVDIPANTNYEIVVLFLNQNLLVTSYGASSIIQGLFDKETVLKTIQDTPMYKKPNKVLFGGSKHWMAKELKKIREEKSGMGRASGRASGSGSKLSDYLAN
jgi:hypothetical protein